MQGPQISGWELLIKDYIFPCALWNIMSGFLTDAPADGYSVIPVTLLLFNNVEKTQTLLTIISEATTCWLMLDT